MTNTKIGEGGNNGQPPGAREAPERRPRAARVANPNLMRAGDPAPNPFAAAADWQAGPNPFAAAAEPEALGPAGGPQAAAAEQDVREPPADRFASPFAHTRFDEPLTLPRQRATRAARAAALPPPMPAIDTTRPLRLERTEDTANTRAFDAALGQVPDPEIWRLFIDRDRQDRGGWTFDVKEPGYAAGMLRALGRARSRFGTRLGVDDVIRLHDLAVEGVLAEPSRGPRTLLPTGLGTAGLQHYRINPEKITAEAWRELDEGHLVAIHGHAWRDLAEHFGDVLQAPEDVARRLAARGEDFDHRPYLSTLFYHGHGHPAVRPLLELDEVMRGNRLLRQRMAAILAAYYATVEGLDAGDSEGRLDVIVKTCRRLEIGHFFQDGNQRTVVFVLLNTWLMENGMSPTVLANPVVFDGLLSARELRAAVREGMQTWQSYRAPHD